MNSAIDQKLSFCDISRGHYNSIKHVRDVGSCFMRCKELAHLLRKFYVKKKLGF